MGKSDEVGWGGSGNGSKAGVVLGWGWRGWGSGRRGVWSVDEVKMPEAGDMGAYAG